MRLISHYVSTIIIVGLYGGQVCPFLDTLSIAQLLIPLVISLVLVWFVRRPLRARLIDLDQEQRYFPLPTKLAIFAAACSFFVMAVLFLVINKDLDWLVTVGDEVSLFAARKIILGELGFVLLVVLGSVLNLIISFTRNLQIFFNNENSVLKEIPGGHLDGMVPVSTNNEFGVMAKHTNLMIAGLREKTEELRLTRDVTIMTLASPAGSWPWPMSMTP